MGNYQQLDLFTGEIYRHNTIKSDTIASTSRAKQLALEVQLSIARMDKISKTMKLVNALCKVFTGIDE